MKNSELALLRKLDTNPKQVEIVLKRKLPKNAFATGRIGQKLEEYLVGTDAQINEYMKIMRRLDGDVTK